MGIRPDKDMLAAIFLRHIPQTPLARLCQENEPLKENYTL